jgi:hypothetical protein
VLTYAAIESEEVSIFKPVVPAAVAVTAANAASVSPEHVTVTDPAARAEVTVNVIALVAYAEVETTEAGEVMPHKLIACAVTRLAGKVSVILLLVACAVNGVDVLKVTAAVPPMPTAVVIWNASRAALTAPMAGMLKKDGTLSVDVSIFKPVVPAAVAVTAADAASVSPEHVTVTDPAARAEVTVNVIALVAYAEVETTEAGEVMPHKLIACVVTRPAGKVSVILLSDACAVKGLVVVKVTVNI